MRQTPKSLKAIISDKDQFVDHTSVGDEFPDAVITGIDLSPIQPSWVPPNVKFMVEDAEAEWLFPDNSLDYIHIRHMTAAIRDWPALLSRAYKSVQDDCSQKLCY